MRCTAKRNCNTRQLFLEEDPLVASHKSVAKKVTSSQSTRDIRIAAVRNALTSYFLGSAGTAELFWNTANPSLDNKSPSHLVKAGKLSKLEQYVSSLRKHARSIKPEVLDEPPLPSVVAFEGTAEEIRERLKEPGVAHGFIVVTFPNAESFYTYAPVYRQIIERLPEIVRRQQRREHLLFARLFYAFTADLPVKVPKLKLRRISNAQELSPGTGRQLSRGFRDEAASH